ncbi:MAG: starch-binding protein [Muribaculaceae bacterium]|nr:starch-binding protein [Muribaculaceae bacterium]
MKKTKTLLALLLTLVVLSAQAYNNPGQLWFFKDTGNGNGTSIPFTKIGDTTYTCEIDASQSVVKGVIINSSASTWTDVHNNKTTYVPSGYNPSSNAEIYKIQDSQYNWSQMVDKTPYWDYCCFEFPENHRYLITMTYDNSKNTFNGKVEYAPAEICIRGENFGNWNSTTTVMNTTDHVNFTIDLETLSGAFKLYNICSGEWYGAKNGNNDGIEIINNLTTNLGDTGYPDYNFKPAAACNNVRIQFNLKTKTMTLSQLTKVSFYFDAPDAWEKTNGGLGVKFYGVKEDGTAVELKATQEKKSPANEINNKYWALNVYTENYKSFYATTKDGSIKTDTWTIYENAVYTVETPTNRLPKYQWDGTTQTLNTEVSYPSTRVYFEKPGSWTNVYCYAFNSTAEENANWPGVTATANKETIGGKEYIYFDVDNRYPYVIFNKNEGTDNQTEDLLVLENGVYTQNSEGMAYPDNIVSGDKVVANHAVSPKGTTILYLPKNSSAIYNTPLVTITGVFGGNYTTNEPMTKISLNGKTYYAITSRRLNAAEKINFTFFNGEKEIQTIKNLNLNDVTRAVNTADYYVINGTNTTITTLSVEDAGLTAATITVGGTNMYAAQATEEDKDANKTTLDGTNTLTVNINDDGQFVFWLKDKSDDGKFWITFNDTRYGVANPTANDNQFINGVYKTVKAGNDDYAQLGNVNRAYEMTFDPRANVLYADWVVVDPAFSICYNGEVYGTDATITGVDAQTNASDGTTMIVSFKSSKSGVMTELGATSADLFTFTLTPGEWEKDFTYYTGNPAYTDVNLPAIGDVDYKDGVYTCAIKVPVGGTYTLTCSFEGNDGYNAQAFSCKVAVRPTIASLGLTINGTTIPTDGTGSMAVNLHDDYGEFLGGSLAHARINTSPNMPLMNGLEIWYKYQTTANNSESNRPAIHRESTDPADGYQKYTGAYGIDVTEGKEVSFLAIQNGVAGEPTGFIRMEEGGTPTGVEGIAAEEGDARYFNLQGVEVENPSAGIYVKVAGGKAVKVIVK